MIFAIIYSVCLPLTLITVHLCNFNICITRSRTVFNQVRIFRYLETTFSQIYYHYKQYSDNCSGSKANVTIDMFLEHTIVTTLA